MIKDKNIANDNGEWIWNEPMEEDRGVIREPAETIPPEPPAERTARRPSTDAQWKEWELRKKQEIAGALAEEKIAQEAKWRADIKKDEKPLRVIGKDVPPMPPEENIGGTTTFRPAAANRADGIRRFSNNPSDVNDPTVGYINDKKPPVSYGAVDDEFSKFHQHVIDTQFDGKDPNLINPYVEADKLADPKIEPERNKVILDRLLKQKTTDIAKLDYFDKMGLANIGRKSKAEEKAAEATAKNMEKVEAGKTAAIQEHGKLTDYLVNIRSYLSEKDPISGKPIVRTPEETNALKKAITVAEKRIRELDDKYKLSEQPEAAPKTELLTEEDKAAVKNEFAARVAKGGITDKAALFKEIAEKIKAGKTQKQTPAASKPVVAPKAVPVIPTEPPAQATKPNPNKARIISKPSPGMALRNMTTAPTPIEYEKADQELIDLASKLGVGPQNWKSLGSYAKAAGEGAWLMYTDAIGRALAGQRKARMNLTGAK